MYYVNKIFSEKCNRYYVGFCADMGARLASHNAGMVTATKNCRPYTQKATRQFPTATEDRKEEASIKKQKRSKYLECLMEGNWSIRPD